MPLKQPAEMPERNAEFIGLCEGMTGKEIEALTGASRITVARWRTGENPVPVSALKLVKLWRMVNAERTCLPADFDKRVNPKNPRWAGYRPRWLRDAENLLTIAPLSFIQLRAWTLFMSVEQCAAFLRVEPDEIERWEAGTVPIPAPAFIALRLAVDIEYLPHQIKAWADWWIIPDGQDVGMLMNRKTGQMIAEPEINAMSHSVSASKRAEERAERENAELREQLATLTAENTRLRHLYQSQGVTKELRQMQERMAALLASIGTAEIIDYAPAKGGNQRRQAA